MIKAATVITIDLSAINAFPVPERTQAGKIGRPCLRRDKPSVYISFVRVGKIEPLYIGIFAGREPEHSVFFYSSNLPEPPAEAK
jgi:hypothetical protein